MKKKPYHYLFEIDSLIKELNTSDKHNSAVKVKEISYFISKFKNIEAIKNYKLSSLDVKIIAIVWHEYIVDRSYGIDSLEIMKKLFNSPSVQIEKLDLIINLLKKNVFYSSKKEIYIKTHDLKADNAIIKFSKASLIANDIEFHHNFVNLILTGEKEDISVSNNVPYPDNKAFLSDWFAYVQKINDFSFNNFMGLELNIEQDTSDAEEYLEIVKWRKRIDSRLENTLEKFPLMNLQQEYGLDDNELIILVYLIKEELEDNNCDSDDLIKLISSDFHEVYQNKEYLSENSRLVKKGLIEKPEGVLSFSQSSSIRAAPDIVRRVIQRNPVNDEECLNQILKNESIFTLIDPI